MLFLGLLIIAIGAFCQSSSYVPINKIKKWSWESYWLVQGIFAYALLPFSAHFLQCRQVTPSGSYLQKHRRLISG